MDTPVNVTAKEYDHRGSQERHGVRVPRQRGERWSGYGGTPSDEAKDTPTDAGPYISVPTDFKVEVGDMMIMASWGKPVKVGADLVKGYTRADQVARRRVGIVDVGMKLRSHLEGLTNGVEYNVWVCPYDGADV